MHDIQIMAEEISLSTRKFPKNTWRYPIMVHNKIRKLLLIGLKTKYNALIL
jgi:hypothetical protein